MSETTDRGFLVREILRFGVIGIASTALHAGLYLLFASGFDITALWANNLAFAIAVVFSYLGHSRVTFRRSPTLRGFWLFVCVSLSSWLVNSGWVILVTRFMTLAYYWAVVPMVLVTPALTFWLNKRWVFRAGKARM